MSRYQTPLAIAIVAMTAVACSPTDNRVYPVASSDRGPIATSRSSAPVVSYPYAAPVYQPVGPVASAPQVQSQPFYTAALPASRPAPAPAQPIFIAPRPAPAELPASRPAQLSMIDNTPYIPASAPISTPRRPARPPARTEMERLNPGMPRLVENSNSQSVNGIARPRRKPTATGVNWAGSVAPSSSSNGFGGIPVPATSSPSYTSSMSTPPMIEYNIPHIPQEEPLWCWAAAAQQAIGWVNNGRAPAQCAIVAMAHGIDVEACCNDVKGICAKTGEIPAIAALVRKFGGQASESAAVPRDPKEVYRILQGGSTLLIRLRPAPHDQAVGIRHMIVVRGIEWLRMPSGQLEATLIYNDPLGSGYRAVSFDEIVGFFEQALIVRRST